MLLVVAAALLSPNYVTALLVMFAFGTMRALAAAMYATRLRDVDETIARIDARYRLYGRCIAGISVAVAIVLPASLIA